MARIPILGSKAAPEAGASRIAFVFPDDHTIDGAKVEILNVTPEQMAVAQLYLQRFALVSMAARDASVQQAQAEAESVRQSLAAERN